MKEIRITRDFLKKPFSSVIILLSIVVLIEAVGWSIGYSIKMQMVDKAGGIFQYIFGKLLRSFFIPELFTLFITIYCLNCFHRFTQIDAIENNWSSIGKYEIQFVPILAGVFLVFNPITQTIRYLLDSFPKYSWSHYWQDYILHTYTWSTYFQYLFPILLVGYIALNISLLSDYLKQRREAQELAEAEAVKASQKILDGYSTSKVTSPPPSPYLSFLKGKNTLGELDFPVSDVYYFTVEDRFYYAELIKGRYLVSKTLNELESELDPSQFFRIKRDYIVNRKAILNYTYWENGKYIVRLNTSDQYNIVVPRARMHEFREWLQGRYADTSEPANTALL